MTNNYYKLLIIQQYVRLQLMLQNNYHDEARKTYENIHKMLDEFFENHKIGKLYYKKMKREMKKYDIMYAGLNKRKMHKGWNRKAYLIGKDHFE